MVEDSQVSRLNYICQFNNCENISLVVYLNLKILVKTYWGFFHVYTTECWNIICFLQNWRQRNWLDVENVTFFTFTHLNYLQRMMYNLPPIIGINVKFNFSLIRYYSVIYISKFCIQHVSTIWHFIFLRSKILIDKYPMWEKQII